LPRLALHRFQLFKIAGVLIAGATSTTGARATLSLSSDGSVIYDSQGVVWLADANLPASMPLTVPLCSSGVSPNCINANGSMNYYAAQKWVADLNAADYLGHNNWQLPATQSLTAGCTAVGPHGESFGYNCSGSALGSLYQGLGLTAPASVASPVNSALKGFTNLQPDLYWTSTSSGGNGYRTFSFATGWSGDNVGGYPSDPSKGPAANFFYVLPALPGDAGLPETIYDPASGLSFLADGNIAAENSFGLPLCSGLGSKSSAPCVNANGTMTAISAEAFKDGMNAYDSGNGYLGRHDWELPPGAEPDCAYQACAANPALDAEDPLASLYYNLLGLAAGDSVADGFTGAIGPFHDLQPYLYWSCQAANDNGPAILSACSPSPQCTPASVPPCAADFNWSFDFLDGFHGTDEYINDLFVTVYYVPEPPAWSVLALAAPVVWTTTRRRRRR